MTFILFITLNEILIRNKHLYDLKRNEAISRLPY